MNGNTAPQDVAEEWIAYIEERGHRVGKTPVVSGVVLSKSGRTRRYRWICLHSKDATRRLTAIEHEVIKRQLELAQKGKDWAYVVVKFETPMPKVVVLPAEKAARMGVISSDKGGIPWNQYGAHESVEEAD
jgi:hypothetical protein